MFSNNMIIVAYHWEVKMVKEKLLRDYDLQQDFLFIFPLIHLMFYFIRTDTYKVSDFCLLHYLEGLYISYLES